MAWFKQLYLLWIILSAAAACVSCQQITSTLREGNHTCPGEEIIFKCTLSSSSLSFVVVVWSSPEYIGQGESLQLSTANMIGVVETSTGMDGNVTATAMVTNNTNINGELILETTLRITAVEASTVTCRDPNGGQASIEFTVSAVPGVPQRIDAAEISRPRDDVCIILVQWDPPTSSDASDIGQYIVYVPSRNIREVSFSTLNTLTLLNCGDDIRIQIAAVNCVGCVGMNSSEVQPVPLDSIPTAPATTGGGSATTTEGGFASTSSQLGVGAIVGITIAVIILLTLCFLGLTFVGIYVYCDCIAGKPTEKSIDMERLSEASETEKPADTEQLLEASDTEKPADTGKHEVQEMLIHELSIIFQEKFQKYLVDFYIAFKKDLHEEDKLSSVNELYQMMEKRTLLSKRYIKEAVKDALKIIKLEYGEGVKRVLIYLKINTPEVLSLFDNKLQDKDTDITMDGLIRAAEQNVHEEVFDELIEIMDNTEPEIVEGLLRTMFEELQAHLLSKASSVEMKWVTNLPGQTSYTDSKDDIPMKPTSRLEPNEEEDPIEFPT